MSRYTKHFIENNREYLLAHGFDHASGYFLQVFDLTAEQHWGKEVLIVDMDSVFGTYDKEVAMDLLTKHGQSDALHRVMLDLQY